MMPRVAVPIRGPSDGEGFARAYSTWPQLIRSLRSINHTLGNLSATQSRICVTQARIASTDKLISLLGREMISESAAVDESASGREN